MKVGYKTQTQQENQPSTEISENISEVRNTPLEKEKFLIWHIEGGLGKNVAATSLIPFLYQKYEDRKIIIVASYPEIFLNIPLVYRVYRVGMTSYFWENYINGKDTLIFRQEPYFQSDHITRKKHLIYNWADLLGLDIRGHDPLPKLTINFVQKQYLQNWSRNKPICLIQTNGGPLENQKNYYSWTRDLPIDLSIYITERLVNDYHIIQVTRPGSPQIPGAEVITGHMSAFELFSLVLASSKRILIDSCLQHAAAALNLPSHVLWIGTSPENFGYSIHHNYKSLPPKNTPKLIDSYLFDYSFDGVVHECPYHNIQEFFDLEELKKIYL